MIRDNVIERDLSCEGCGADLLVSIEVLQVAYDYETGPEYEFVFNGASCSRNPQYGCMCPIRLQMTEDEYVKKLTDQFMDELQSEGEKAMEARWER